MLTLLDLRERGGRLEPTKLEIDPATAETVREILQRVFVEGDEVLIALAAEFDHADLTDTGILVDDDDYARAERDTPDDLKQALDDLIGRLRDLAERQTPREWWHERDGVRYGEIVRPLRTIGCYVPGGRARYPSTVAMTVVPGGGRRGRGDRGVHAAADRRDGARARCCTRRNERARRTSPGPAAPKPSRRWPTAPSRSRRSTASSVRATSTSPRPSVRSRGSSGSTASPVRPSSRSWPTATSTRGWPRST